MTKKKDKTSLSAPMPEPPTTVDEPVSDQHSAGPTGGQKEAPAIAQVFKEIIDTMESFKRRLDAVEAKITTTREPKAESEIAAMLKSASDNPILKPILEALPDVLRNLSGGEQNPLVTAITHQIITKEKEWINTRAKQIVDAIYSNTPLYQGEPLK